MIDQATRKERRIEALKRIGYEARYWGYGDDWGYEIGGCSIYFNGDEQEVDGFPETEDEAWDEFLKSIGKA